MSTSISYLSVAYSDFLVDKPVTYRSLAGVAVVMLIAVLSALAALAYVYQRRTRHQAAVPSFENPMYYTTENLPPENKDTKTLVDNMEINN